MATDKKSFLLYCDLIHTISKMPNDKAGELFKHILEYVNDKDPVTEDLIIQLTFEPIKQSLKRDLDKYERIRLKNVDNAHKRWNKDNATAYERIPNDTKNADSGIDSVSDSVSDSVNDKDNNKGKRKAFTPPILENVKLYFIENGYSEQSAEKAFNYYNEGSWKDSKGNAVKNWKQKMISVWFKDENKVQAKKIYDPNLPAPQSNRIVQ
jgi:hypothetical protein